ncbi:MAG: hypothetical protein M1830_000252 [Pleopsidium flavum]|nr:MAG: hypothetical protein M1830_000252 [Pleopsidium flavum]
MPMKEPDTLQWTLRFKQNKTTILLFVDPGQSFDSIKQDLLDALKKSGRTELNGEPVPSDSDHVLLGLPMDKNDLSKGWVKLEIPETEIEDGLGAKKKVGGKKSILNASPQGAGLKDGAVLAFRFSESGDKVDEEGLEVGYGKWDVVIPSYEDEYGSQADGQGSQ